MKTILSLMLVVCLGACQAQEPKSKMVVLSNRTVFGVHFENNNVVIDTTYFCEPEFSMVKITEDTVTISNERGTIHVPVYERLGDGIFMLTTGDSIPIILHVFEDKDGSFALYFHKRDLLTRLSTVAMPCNEL